MQFLFNRVFHPFLPQVVQYTLLPPRNLLPVLYPPLHRDMQSEHNLVHRRLRLEMRQADWEYCRNWKRQHEFQRATMIHTDIQEAGQQIRDSIRLTSFDDGQATI
ncbi:hypothetical protein BLNAU_13655 [Blattamonas nauphoetae]|uniref:Uncharacterized protein n=1 Tax=Blattamonas nauphoetae TaxID=2049346 RepID=A0ABQ9XJJ4_9EUKA|nr:hypothetical protein BLNAU_13655 [Blattamonas nauphoetae]